MAINFPSSPSLNQLLTVGNVTWKYNGVAWELQPTNSPVFQTITTSTVDTTTLNGTTVNATNLNITGDVSGISLQDLENVNITGTPTAGQVLGYNTGTSVWEPQTSSFNGGSITNQLIVNNATVSTGSTSGALRVTGGVGVGDDIFVGGSITIEDENLNIKTSGEARFYNTSNANYVGFSAPDTITADKIYVLPQQDGSSGQFLRTNGSGILSWASASGAGGGTPPGGVDTNVQYNDSDSFGGSSTFTFNSETGLVTLPKLTSTDTTASTTSSTGAIVTGGGVGVAGQLNVAGATNKFTGGTESTSTITGTVIVTGGVGISGAINIGSTASADTAPSNAEHLTNKRYVDANILAFSVAFGA